MTNHRVDPQLSPQITEFKKKSKERGLQLEKEWAQNCKPGLRPTNADFLKDSLRIYKIFINPPKITQQS